MGSLVLALTGLGAGSATAAPASPSPSSAADPSVLLVDVPLVKTLRRTASTPRPTEPTGGPAPLLRTAGPTSADGPPRSTWEITYRGFEANPAARESFQAAVDTWAALVASPVAIKVTATMKDLGDPKVLGQAAPSDFVVLDRDRDGTRDTAYPVALANAVIGTDLSPRSSRSSGQDVDAEFNSNAGKVYYGTDGAVPRGFVDFRTVVLHELGHGLGFLGSMDVDKDGVGTYGSGTPYPLVFDRFAALSSGEVQRKPLTSYPSGGTALGEALTSGAVYWDGPLGKAAYDGRPPRLYVPEQFERGSSFSHLSDADFPPTDVNSLLTPFVEDEEVVHHPGPVALGMFADMGWVTPPPPGHRFTPLDPVRILDTIRGVGSPVSRLGPGEFRDVTVTGKGGVPLDAKAVVLNLTGVGPTGATDLRVYPTPKSGTARPLISTLNLARKDIRANLATVAVGDGGRVRILNSRGTTHVLGDVSGWYGPGASSSYHPVDPVRILDTRASGRPLLAGEPRDVVVTGGPAAVPANAAAVVLTVTGLHATSRTDLRAYPKPTRPDDAPEVSNLNLQPRDIVPNLVVAKVGADGVVRLLNSAGSLHVLVDVAGWYDEGQGSLFHVLAPERVLDTRADPVPRLGPGEHLDVALHGVAGIADRATAVALNVTGVGATRTTDVAVYPRPTDGRVPLVSNLNLLRRQTNANAVVTGLGPGGRIRLRNAAGELALVADVAGWFGP